MNMILKSFQLNLLGLLMLISGSLVKCAYNFTLDERSGYNSPGGLTTLFQWGQLDWSYESESARQQAIANGEFVEGVGFPIDSDVYYPGSSGQQASVFITVPRFSKGIPASFNTINKDGKLTPYPPDWSWHSQSNACRDNRIVSVFRTQIDECDRLWLADTGVIDGQQICPPQILAFDLATNRLIVKYEVPRDQYISGETLFITPAVDVRDPQQGCRDTFLYIADVTRYALLVFDVQRQTSWRITNNLFYPYPNQGVFNIAGESFDLMDGLFGLALSPYVPNTDRTLYFHALASVTENRVPTSVIRNQSLFAENSNAAPRAFYLYPHTRKSQATTIAIDRKGIEYFVLTKQLALACWNTRTEYGSRNIHVIEENPVTLQFASGVKMVRNKAGGEELWVVTIRFQKIMNGDLNPNEINFRVMGAKTENLLRNSRCIQQPQNNVRPYMPPTQHGYGFIPRPNGFY